jgi:hypothetical protein
MRPTFASQASRSASAQIAAEFEEIERVEDRISNPVPAVERSEHRNAIRLQTMASTLRLWPQNSSGRSPRRPPMVPRSAKRL